MVKGEYVKFKNFERKIKFPFIIHADFESISVSKDNGKQNPNESYTNKHQKYVTYSYGYKLVCAADKFSKPFKWYLGEDVVYNFISSMIEESKYCSDVIKKLFNKELVMTKKDNRDFENSTKCWTCDNYYIDNDVKVRDNCHITGKYRVSAHRNCNINVELNHKIPVVFHNLKNYDSHLFIQELGKFKLKITVIPNELEKYKWFKYLSQKFEVLDLRKKLRKKGLIFMNVWAILKSLKKNYRVNSLTGKKIIHKQYDHVLKIWNNLKWKRWNIITICI